MADTFALIVNHLKSKASGSGTNADQGDGQGASNLRRKTQAAALVQFINTTVKPAGTRYVVSVGDYNANYEEDPMDIMRAAGFVLGSPASSASYVFDGLSGSLDHAVLTPNLVAHAAVEKWHINAAEPEFLEYGRGRHCYRRQQPVPVFRPRPGAHRPETSAAPSRPPSSPKT